MTSRNRRTRLLSRFHRAERGATAVEFALVALPFLILLFGIVELAMVFIVSTTLEGATESASRRIRTGEFQTGGATTKQDFKNLVCARMSWLKAGCDASLSVDVRTFNDFSSLAASPQLDPVLFDPTNTCWSTGQPTDIVLVRTYFRWKLFTPLLDSALQNSVNGERLINAVSAFRNEPYNSNPAGGAKC